MEDCVYLKNKIKREDLGPHMLVTFTSLLFVQGNYTMVIQAPREMKKLSALPRKCLYEVTYKPQIFEMEDGTITLRNIYFHLIKL